MTPHAFYKQCLAICARGFDNHFAANAWFTKRRERIYALPVPLAARVIVAFGQTSLKGHCVSQRGAPSKDL